MLKLNLIIFSGLLILSEKAHPYIPAVDIKCSGVLNHSENIEKDTYYTKMQVAVIIMKNKTGHVTLSGQLSSFKTVYTINRAINFTYQSNNNTFGIYDTEFNSIYKAGGDNIPDTIFNKHMSLLSFGKSKVIRVNKLPSGNLLISSAFGPLFICVP